MGASLIRGNALRLPLRNRSVHLALSSPPYWSLRQYSDSGDALDGQLGSEPNPWLYLANLWACMDEVWRVLRDDGSCFVNLGDKFCQRPGQYSKPDSGITTGRVDAPFGAPATVASTGNLRPKTRMGLPHRFYEGCVDPDYRRWTEARAGLPPTSTAPQWVGRMDIVWCLSGGAKVYARTAAGDRPIMVRDLARAYQPENVKLWNGEKWTQVLGWNRSADTDGALELELRSGERIGCTVGHQWPTQRGLLRADEIRVGDLLDTCRLPEPDEPRNPRLLPDGDIGWLVGLYIAEGSRSGTMIQIAGHANEELRHARLARIVEALDGQCNVYQTSENGVTCNLSGSALAGVIDRYVSVGTAHTKRLTLAAWQRSDVFLASVVEGYLAGDGHYDAKNERWRLGFTRNDDWSADLRTLAARLGATITLKRGTAWGFDKEWDIWRGEWRWHTRRHWNRKPRNEVLAIRFSRARQFFDIGVEDEPHTFALASGVLTHNSKPNGLPESVSDRVRASHEYVFHLTKNERYYAAIDEVREPHVFSEDTNRTHKNIRPSRVDNADENTRGIFNGAERERILNPLGKLPGSVWQIASEPLIVPPEIGVDHFAAWPSELARRIVLGWSPPGVCTACGEGRRPVSERGAPFPREQFAAGRRGKVTVERGDGATINNIRGQERNAWRFEHPDRIVGYACACPDATAPTTPATVLDWFSGTGCTAAVASALGRNGVGVELSADYNRLAAWRIKDPALRAKVLGVDKPPKQVDGQGSLFDGSAA